MGRKNKIKGKRARVGGSLEVSQPLGVFPTGKRKERTEAKVDLALRKNRLDKYLTENKKNIKEGVAKAAKLPTLDDIGPKFWEIDRKTLDEKIKSLRETCIGILTGENVLRYEYDGEVKEFNGKALLKKYPQLQMIVKKVLNYEAVGGKKFIQGLIPFIWKDGKIEERKVKQKVKQDGGASAAAEGTGPCGNDNKAAVVEAGQQLNRTLGVSPQGITGQEAAEQALAMLIATAQRQGGELTPQQQQQLERLAMIAHTAQRQNAAIKMAKRAQCCKILWKTCNEILKWLTTILAGVAARYILSMFTGLAGILTGGLSGLIGLFFTLIVGVFTTSINGIAGWFTSSPLFSPTDEILGNITSTIMNDSRMKPVLDAALSFGWSTNVVAWIILFFILLLLFHIPRLMSQANEISFLGFKIGAREPTVEPEWKHLLSRPKDPAAERNKLALAAARQRKIEDADTDALAIAAGKIKEKGGGERKKRSRRRKRGQKKKKSRRRKYRRRRRHRTSKKGKRLTRRKKRKRRTLKKR